jgi:hypothetical protein
MSPEDALLLRERRVPRIPSIPWHYVLFTIVASPFISLMYLVVSKVFQRIRFNEKERRLAAKPKNLVALKDPVLGLDYAFEIVKAAKQSRYMDWIGERFKAYGDTYVCRRLFFDTVHTIDPDNIKSILSTDFHSFQIPTARSAAMNPLFGEGIFAVNGEKWSQ